MAKKKVEVTLQEEVNTQEEWDTILQREGLLVIDIYQDWCGPCKAVVGLFRRLKAETNDDMLHFIVAKADTIDCLEKYRQKCEPCFLFYGGGCLVAVVRGVNPPELERFILEKLKMEHEVMNGEAERIQIKDPLIAAQEKREAEARRQREEEEDISQEVTLAILKPDVISSGTAENIVTELEENGFEILERKEHILNLEEAETLYEELKDEGFYSNLIEFITSGPCILLLCAKGPEGAVDELHSFIGPQVQDNSTGEIRLRNKYGTDRIKNAIHISENKERAFCEVALFFPDFKAPIVKVRRIRYVSETSEEVTSTENITVYGQALRFAYTTPNVQLTVALLRPKAHECYKEEILEKIKEAGFVIALEKEMILSKEKAEAFYHDHQSEDYFDELIKNMLSGPILALLLARKNAVETWRNMLGPTDVEQARSSEPGSLRAQFADVVEEDGLESGEGVLRTKLNLLHGSATLDETKRDIDFFFPVQRTVAMIKPDAYANRDEIVERIRGHGFHIAATKDVELTKEAASQLYVELQGKPFYEDLVTHMTSGCSVFMVLTRRDAVFGWRKLMGHSDPDKAADECPNKTDAKSMNIRATYGRNVLQNAVHGSSSEEHATRVIELIFEDAEIGLPGMTVDFGVTTESHTEGQLNEGSERKASQEVELSKALGESGKPSQEAEMSKPLEEMGMLSSEVEPSGPLDGADIASPEVEISKPLEDEPQNVDASKPVDEEKVQEVGEADATANDIQASESGLRDEIPSEVIGGNVPEEGNIPDAEANAEEDPAAPMENQSASGGRKKTVASVSHRNRSVHR